MNRKSILIVIGLLVCGSAWAVDTSNQENFDDLKAMVFAQDAQPGTTITQKNDKGCVLTMNLTRYGVALTLNAGPGKVATFRASVSGKVSTNYEVELDENAIEVYQIALSSDERGAYANNEHLKMLTLERPGEKDLNNIQGITISNQLTSDWTTDASGKEVPDFSKSHPPIEVSCTFN